MLLAILLSLTALVQADLGFSLAKHFGAFATRIEVLHASKASVPELKVCMRSTDSVNISVHKHEDDILVNAVTRNCTRPNVGPGCVATWSVKALLSAFAQQSPAWLEDDNLSDLESRGVKVNDSNCAAQGGILQMLHEAYDNLNASSVCILDKDDIESRKVSSCAIVGGSPLLGRKPRSHEIDESHELVFRYNDHTMHASHSGRRADIWILNQMFAKPSKFRQVVRQNGFEITSRTLFMQIAIQKQVVQNFNDDARGDKPKDAKDCGRHLLISPRLIKNACILSDGAISTGQLGLFIAASMCRHVDAYGFTPYNISNLFGLSYTHDSALMKSRLVIDNVEVLQMTFNQLLHCLRLIQLHDD